jgi:hypothetical protein
MPYRVVFRGSDGLWALSRRFETAGEAERYLAALPARQKRLIALPAAPPAPAVPPVPAAPAAPAAPLALAPRGAGQALLDLLLAGLTPDELSRLADLRVRVRRGAVGGAGDGRAPEAGLDARRLEFARWLVQTGRLHDR